MESASVKALKKHIKVLEEVNKQKETLATKETIDQSLESYGIILIADNIEDCIDFANNYAPEHLEIVTKNNKEVLEKINNVGSVFLGSHSEFFSRMHPCCVLMGQIEKGDSPDQSTFDQSYSVISLCFCAKASLIVIICGHSGSFYRIVQDFRLFS